MRRAMSLARRAIEFRLKAVEFRQKGGFILTRGRLTFERKAVASNAGRGQKEEKWPLEPLFLYYI